MSYATALAAAQQLAAAIQRRGVTVSIELQQGASQNGTKRWDRSTPKVGVLSHHTVSRPSQGATPCLALVKRGRSDVPGPLCNGYGGYDLVYRIITMDIANHSGAGGPLWVPGFTIPKDQGRYYLWGTEYEGGLEAWTPEMREFMARANAGILDYLGLQVAAHGEHLTWAPRRKIDRLGYTTQSGQSEIITLGGKSGTLPPVTQPPADPWAGANPDAVYELGSRNLRLYSSGTDVRYVQRVVGVEDDGYYGPLTVAGVKAYQLAHGLTYDGLWGPQCWGYVGVIKPPVSVPTPPSGLIKRAPSYPSAIRYGSKGPLVGLTQEILKRDNCYAGEIDDSWGPIMQRGAIAFQKKHGLTADGSFWKESFAQLLICNGALDKGDSGPEVGLLQVYLGWGIGSAGNDRSFGPATDTRTREMQRFLGIGVDGSVWTQTASALKR